MRERLTSLYKQYAGQTWVRIAAVILLLGLTASVFFGPGGEPVVEVLPAATTVEVASVRELASGSSFSAVGTVTAISEARLETEAGGRVVSVTTEIGARVAAGQVLATLENSAERAALVQAEGSYEAAVAGAKQSDSGVRGASTGLENARNTAKAAVRASLTDVSSVIVKSIDPFFSDPNSFVPGLRIDGNAQVLNAERVAYQKLLPEWQTQINGLTDENLYDQIATAETQVTRTIAFVELFVAQTNNADRNDTLFGVPTNSLTNGLLAESARLNTTLQALKAAKTGLADAEEALARATIGGTSADVSLANAQVKIALGSLQAAQAAYQKTIVRSPISGVVNALYLKAGQYVGSGQPAAIVANNNGLEIATAINQEESANLAIGDEVVIDGTASGTVTAIAGAVDPTTGKIAVKVSVADDSELQNGSTATVLFINENSSTETKIMIPLSSVKMTGSGPVVFKVTDENTLSGRSITLGAISGESVIVEEGIALEDQIVVDARGLKEGQAVTAESN